MIPTINLFQFNGERVKLAFEWHDDGEEGYWETYFATLDDIPIPDDGDFGYCPRY